MCDKSDQIRLTISFWGQTFCVEEEEKGGQNPRESGRTLPGSREETLVRSKTSRTQERETNETIVEIREIVQPFRGTFHTHLKYIFESFTMAREIPFARVVDL